MGTRLDLHEKLITIPEINDHAYYQPPEGFKMKYPCIVYELEREDVVNADNLIYNRKKRYTLTVIDRDPESMIAAKLGELLQIKMDRHFKSDNLHHFVYYLTY